MAVGRFDFTRLMRLLDVSALQSVYIEGSIFDASYIKRLERAKFLERLSARFSTPVMPGDEPLDYIPTQAIADYLASWPTPPLDGILYPSVQGGAKGANLVLFHKSARVSAADLPPGTQVSINAGFETEDGWEEDWTIWEETPAEEDTIKKQQPADLIFGTDFLTSDFANDDLREEVLTMDRTSIRLHLVKAARYETHSSTITRYQRKRRESTEKPDF